MSTSIEREIAKAMTEAALLEAMGEEAIEFGQACYKKARKLRGESPTDDSFLDIDKRIGKEYGDFINILVVMEMKGIFPKVPDNHMINQTKRWYERLVKEGIIRPDKARD